MDVVEADEENSSNSTKTADTAADSFPKLPLILRQCFKQVKQVDQSDVNISAVCNLCSKVIKGSVTSTTNFLKHLKIKGHAGVLEKYETSKVKDKKRKQHDNDLNDHEANEVKSGPSKKLKQSTLTSLTSATTARSINLDKLIVKFVVGTMSPVAIVEHKSFKALLEGAQQLTKPPKIMCRRTTNKKISEEFCEYKETIKNELKTVNFVCSTCDVWSSSKRSYLGVTVHWIDNGTFDRGSAAIACRRFKGSHTFDKVAELLSDIHSEYDLKLSKLVKTITDNGSNMVKAFEVFGKSDAETFENENQTFGTFGEGEKEDFNEDEDKEDDEILMLQPFPIPDASEYVTELPAHERCATHTLNLVCTDFKQARLKNNLYRKMYDATFSKCQALWNLCSRSPKACETYLEITGKSPTSPCATRWNSYYNSLNDLLSVQNHLSDTMKALKLPTFKENELFFITEYVECSKPIAEAILSLQGEKETYYGCLLPELIRIQHIITSLRMENSTYCRPLLDVIQENLQKRFKKFLQLETSANDAILASVSHPFFKLKWVPREKKEQVKELFLAETRRIARAEKQKADAIMDKNNPEDNKKRSKDESYYMFLEDSDSSIASSENTGSGSGSSADLEALQYLNNKDTSLRSLTIYPTIKNIFFKYNTCLPSSAPVERLFSFGGMIMRPHRRKMNDKLFEELVLLKSEMEK